MYRIFLAFLLLTACGGTSTQGVIEGDLDDDLEALRTEYGLAGLSVGLLRDGRLVHTGTYGQAKSDSIYALASVSKIFVGLAIARAIEDGQVDLDTDVSEYLGWQVQHPDFPNVPVTLRQLVAHRAGLEADGPEDYDTYPKPDADQPLDAFLQARLADEEYWLSEAPGEVEEYSNYGTALAALVVQKAVGRPFEQYCNEVLFRPLGMADTRWFFSELSSAQQARVVRPLDEEGGAYEHYGFNDWPSGQLRSTVADLAKVLAFLIEGERTGVLSSEGVSVFEGTPLFIEVESAGDSTTYGHSGGEVGVNTYVEYTSDGDGLIILSNQDMADGDDEAFFDAVIARLKAE